MSGITAILPAFNEEVSIGSIVLRTKHHVDRVIVIDDGSTDRTAEVAKLAGADVIIHPLNKGKGEALKTGFEAAGGAEVILTMDTDGQHNPEEIPKLIAPIIAGDADIVNGSRYLNGNRKGTPLYRRLGQVVLDRATNLNSRLEITDTQSGFRAFNAKITHIFRFKQKGLAIESGMLLDAARAGLRIKEVEIDVRYDVDGSSEDPLSHGIKVLTKILQDMEWNQPLFFFTVPGVALSAIGIGMGLEFLQSFYHGGSLFFGPTLLMILLTLMGSFLALAGVILHSISRLLKESRDDLTHSQRHNYENINYSRDQARDN